MLSLPGPQWLEEQRQQLAAGGAEQVAQPQLNTTVDYSASQQTPSKKGALTKEQIPSEEDLGNWSHHIGGTSSLLRSTRL